MASQAARRIAPSTGGVSLPADPLSDTEAEGESSGDSSDYSDNSDGSDN
jgi:hypothetical protein